MRARKRHGWTHLACAGKRRGATNRSDATGASAFGIGCVYNGFAFGRLSRLLSASDSERGQGHRFRRRDDWDCRYCQLGDPGAPTRHIQPSEVHPVRIINYALPCLELEKRRR